MTPPEPSPTIPPRRFVLPLLCAALTVLFSFSGEYILVEYAGLSSLGPLVAAQVSTLISISFGLLGIITLLLAVFPGRDEPAHDDDQHLPGSASGSQSSLGLAGRPPEEIISALKDAATEQQQERLKAEERCEEATARASDLERRIAGFLDGTAPEIEQAQAKARDEANREALRQVQSLATAADRRANALIQARERVEADLARAEQTIAEQQRDLDAALEEARTARQEGAADEYRRITLAVAAINSSSLDFHDPLQNQAVARHADRITEALLRLSPEHADATGPGVSMPPLAAPPSEQPRKGSRGKRTKLRRRKDT